MFLAPRVFNRRGSLTMLGGWREATQVGFYGFGTETTSKANRANYAFKQPFGSAALDFWPTRQLLLLSRRPGSVAVEPGSGTRRGAVGGRGLHAGDAPGTWQPSGLPALAREESASTGARRPVTPAPAAPTAITFHDYRDQGGAFGFRRTDYEAFQHIPVLRDAWVLSLHGRLELANAADQRRFPSSCCRRSAAVRRCAASRAGASAISTACCCRPSGACWSTASSTWRRSTTPGASRRAAATGSRALKSDYGLGFRFHGPLATPLRIELAKSNEGLRLGLLVEGRVLRGPCPTRAPDSGVRARRVAAGVRCCALVATPPAPRFYPDDPLAREPESRRMPPPRSRPDVGLFYDLSYNLFVDAAARAVEHPRQKRQHDRRGARFELVHQSHRRRAASSTTRSSRGPRTGPPPDPERWVIMREKSAGDASRLHRQGRQRRDLVRLVRPAGESRGRHRRGRRREQVVLGARLQPGRDLHHDGRSQHGRRSIRRPRCAAPTASGRRSPATTSTRSSSAPRANPTAPIAWPPAACCPARSSGRSATRARAPTTRTTSSPHEHRRELRALRVFGAWTNLTDLKAGNTLDTLVTENGRAVVQALPAGRRLDVRHRRQRSARLGHGLGILLRGRRRRDGGCCRSASRSARGRRCRYVEYPSIGRFEGDAFDPTTWKPQTPTTAYMEMRRRRCVLGGAPRGGVHRRR